MIKVKKYLLEVRHCVPVAQLDRVFDYESKGHRFESCRARHFFIRNAPVAQWIEHRFPKPQVGRSSRLGRATIPPATTTYQNQSRPKAVCFFGGFFCDHKRSCFEAAKGTWKTISVVETIMFCTFILFMERWYIWWLRPRWWIQKETVNGYKERIKSWQRGLSALFVK